LIFNRSQEGDQGMRGLQASRGAIDVSVISEMSKQRAIKKEQQYANWKECS